MHTCYRSRLAPIGIVAVLGTWLPAPASGEDPVGPTLTYQGEVLHDGLLVNANSDFEFSLWDAAAGGNQLGSTLAFDDYPVVDGRFTVQLDFGYAFDGNIRYLEIAVRSPSGVGGFTTLSPRQELTPAPYALYALNAGGASDYWTLNGSNLTNSTGDFVGIHRDTPVTSAEYFGVQAPVQSGYGGMYIRTDGDAGLPFYGYRAGTKSVWHYLDGTTSKWHLYNSGRRVTVDSLGHVGIGTDNPEHRLHVVTSSGRAIQGETNDASEYAGYFLNDTSGSAVFAQTLSGTGVFGFGAGDFGTGVRGDTAGYSGIGVLGRRPNPQGTDPAVRGQTFSYTPGAVGVHGLAQSQSTQGATYGVLGQSSAYFGVGVRGESYIGVEGKGQHIGVSGTVIDIGGEGVHGEGTYGVRGLGNDGGAGVVGEAGNGATYGVHAIGHGAEGDQPALRADGGSGPAIYALGDRAIAGEGTVFGVSGLTFDPDGYGGIFSNLGDGVALKATGRAEVDGTLSVQVLEIQGGADLAERFPLSEAAEPGLVVAIDPDDPGRLRISREAYNQRVVGVISGANDLSAGVVLGDEPGSDRHRPIALTGRVWVECDTRARGVEPGDLLTTSDLPGHAMPVLDRSRADGAIIGKAMSRLERGADGMVLLLVNLQ